MKVGVIGAGTMGQGIAKAFAQTEGYEVMLCDIKQEWAEGGKDKIAKGYAKLVAKEKMTQEQADAIVAKITPGLKEDLCADCDLIVEAAFENMEVKKTTFGELDKICKPETIFASNTSSLSITEIGNGLTRPMIGMHFFNPADRMKLIEVIAGVNTPAETVDAIKNAINLLLCHFSFFNKFCISFYNLVFSAVSPLLLNIAECNFVAFGLSECLCNALSHGACTNNAYLH